MRIAFIKIKGTWREICDSCRVTVGKEAGQGEPSSAYKRRLLLSEHSPIRKLIVNWKWTSLLWWTQTHFTRHHVGVEWFVQTSREDRTSIKREGLSQDAPVDVEGEANAQAIINISRKRLCTKASPETRQAWQAFLINLKAVEPELVSVCVRECVYRGWCFEMDSCGYHQTQGFRDALNAYRANINGWDNLNIKEDN